MQTHNVTIHNEQGLHTRPGARLVKIAQSFDCNIRIKTDHKTVNAKSLIKLMTLGIEQGDTIELQAQGTDEVQAIARLVDFFAQMS